MRRILLALTCRENELWRRPITAHYHEKKKMTIKAKSDAVPVMTRITIRSFCHNGCGGGLRDADFSISYIFAIGELLRKWKDEQPHYLSLSQHFERLLLALIGLLVRVVVLAKETIFASLVEGGCFWRMEKVLLYHWNHLVVFRCFFSNGMIVCQWCYQ